jgi:hypothetical protein
MKYTCTSARNLAGEMCGYPALFRYKGYKLPTLFMCGDCAYAIVHDLGWQLKDRLCILEPLDMLKLRAFCSSCHVDLFVGWNTNAPAQGNPGEFMFCPRCGAHQLYAIDQERDYWEVMSVAFGDSGVPFPITLLQQLYIEWPRNKYQRFADFVAAQMAAFDETGELMEV